MAIDRETFAAKLVAIRDNPNTDPGVARQAAEVLRDKPELQDLVAMDATITTTLDEDPAVITPERMQIALQLGLRNFEKMPINPAEATLVGPFGKRAATQGNVRPVQ